MNAKAIAWTLAKNRRSPFYVRKQFAVVPNVSWGLLTWEADLLSCTQNGFLTEVEIKISMADWKSDFEKAKFRPDYQSHWTLIKQFYYAAPRELAIRYHELPLPDFAGVIAVDEDLVSVLRKAKVRQPHRRLDFTEMLQLARLGTMKAWRMAHKPSEPA